MREKMDVFMETIEQSYIVSSNITLHGRLYIIR
jgi:hypothetical protein